MSYKKWCEAVILIVSTLWCHLVYIRPWCYTHFVYLHRSVMVRLWQLLLEVPSIIIHKWEHIWKTSPELFFHSCTMNAPCNACHWVTLTSHMCNSQGNVQQSRKFNACASHQQLTDMTTMTFRPVQLARLSLHGNTLKFWYHGLYGVSALNDSVASRHLNRSFMMIIWQMLVEATSVVKGGRNFTMICHSCIINEWFYSCFIHNDAVPTCPAPIETHNMLNDS